MRNTVVSGDDIRPAREDAEQGALGDAGLIAVLGAVAAHLPDEIARRVRPRGDGSYLVLLAEARCTATGAVATGRRIELLITPDLPVYDHSPGEPAYAKADTAAWAAIAEKALAGVDATWTPRRRAQWEQTWNGLCAADAADPAIINPRRGPPPAGYVRLNQGSTTFDHAEALTQLTGRHAVGRQFRRGHGRIRRALRRQLRAAKPVIVTTRPPARPGEILPHQLIASHCYEVTGAGWRTAALRNPWGFAHPQRVPLRRFAGLFGASYATLA